MIAAIAGEVRRALSGWSVLPILGLMVLVPAMVLTSGTDPAVIARVESPVDATAAVLAPLAWSFVAAAFLGSYTVTREHYYGSLVRTLLVVGRERAMIAKAVGGAVTAVGLTLVLCALWCIAMSVLLIANESRFALSSAVFTTVASALGAAALGAVGGTAIAWIVRNYYAAAAIVVAGPIAVEMVALGEQPELARFSPGLTLAAITAPGFRDELLDRPAAIGLSLAWIVLASIAAFVVVRRRDA